jgi:hypothetical protein
VSAYPPHELSSFRVLLDACVLYPAALRDLLLRLAEAGVYRAHWSDMVLDELTRTLVRNGRMTDAKARDHLTLLREVFPEAMVRGYEPLVPAMTNHPKDRHVLAAAVVCGAQVIVTSNLRHFPESALGPYNIDAQSPSVFLQHVLDLYQDVLLDVLVQQAADLHNPPMTVGEVVDEIAIHAPEFAEAVREKLSLTE